MTSSKLTRRDVLKIQALALGGIALEGVLSGCSSVLAPAQKPAPTTEKAPDPSQTNSLFNSLPPYYPGTESLAADEMRITFLGTSCIPRLAQECNSIFVEVGSAKGKPDQFVFDCGSGVAAKYNAAGIQMSRMDKIFLTHLHGDHTSDLIHIYCFGPAEDRKSPLYIWGPSPSLLTDPVSGHYYDDDGTKAFCEKFREVMRWHSESFSFGATGYESYTPPSQESWGLPAAPVPVGSDDPKDGYAIVPIELDWQKSGTVPGDNVAYDNPATGVKITHFPAIHCRQGSISYRLEWNGLSMIFTGDTKPNYNLINQAPGVDVLVHEMVVPADVWAMKNLGITDPSQVSSQIWNAAYNYATEVQNSSHTPQGAFGYILSQIKPAPKLTVATHFQAADDTIASATKSVREHYPSGDLTFASDLMVINVSKDKITQRRAVVSDLSFYPVGNLYSDLITPKYHNPDGTGNPTAQVDLSQAVPATDPKTGNVNYRTDGY